MQFQLDIRKNRKFFIVLLFPLSLFISYPLIEILLSQQFERLNFDNITHGFLGIFGFLFIFLSIYFPNLFSKARLINKRCTICQQMANDILVIDGGKKNIYYCRNHLLRDFVKYFKSFPYKMVVFHPEQEREYCGTMYPYYPLDEMVTKYNFSKEDARVVEKIIGSITGQCIKCGKDTAQVAYYRKGILEWDEGGPILRNTKASSELLCSNCTLTFIKSDLQRNKKFFIDNGLFVPYKGEGVFVNTYL